MGASSHRVPRCTIKTLVVNRSNRFSENATMRIALISSALSVVNNVAAVPSRNQTE
jgi:hypothetical protein